MKDCRKLARNQLESRNHPYARTAFRLRTSGTIQIVNTFGQASLLTLLIKEILV